MVAEDDLILSAFRRMIDGPCGNGRQQRLAELAGVAHEQRDEGLVIFNLVPKAADGLPESAASISIPQPSDEAPAITEEPGAETAATPAEVGQAAPDAGTGDVV